MKNAHRARLRLDLARHIGAALVVAALAAPACAEIICPALWSGGYTPENRYFALLFLKPAPLGDERQRLVDTVSDTFAAMTRSISRRANSPRLDVQLLICEHKVATDDLSAHEASVTGSSKVIAAFWESQEGTKRGLVHLAIPLFGLLKDVPRREFEVVTALDNTAAAPSVDQWIEVLVDGKTLAPFISMGLATVHQARKERAAAWVAYCESRNGLVALQRQLLRPAQEALEQDLLATVTRNMAELGAQAQKAGSPLPPCPAMKTVP